MDKSLKDRLANLPVPILPTTVGMLTLSNIYKGLGFPSIRHIFMILGTVIWIAYIFKMIFYKETVLNEYSQTVPSSLYAGFSMTMMLLGSYYVDYNYVLGKGLWFLGIIIHIIHILVFTYRNVIKERNKTTFVPSWFVTYNGLLVSVVIGGAMNEPKLTTFIAYYGICIYFIIIPFMIKRLLTVPIPKTLYHTQAIVLAPCSLSIVAYLNTVKDPNTTLVYILYLAVLLSLAFVIMKLPRFFSLEFTPAYAGLTFPMGIGIVATAKMVDFLESIGKSNLAGYLEQLRGIQIYITTFIIGYVLIKFAGMLFNTEEKMKKIYPN